MKTASALLFAVLLLSGCAPYRYHAVPASPPVIATRLEARRLDDPNLRTWMDSAVHYQPPVWPQRSWNLRTLTFAAWYFSPDLDVARQQMGEAQAAIRTAAMKPNPSAGSDAGYETAPEAPFLANLNLDFPIETAGKRRYRVAAARHLSLASQCQLDEDAWMVRARLRRAWVSYALAIREHDLLRDQESLQSRYTDLLDWQMRAGQIPLPEVTTARLDLMRLRQSLSEAEGGIATARAALAGAIGIPTSALSGIDISTVEFSSPPSPESLPLNTATDLAVRNRLDVQAALEEYQATQARLQLEVARQYPDIDLGPGYGYEEGYQLVTAGLSAILPLRNRNQGPIAEAEAQRKLAGARLLSTQSTVISQTDQAEAQYRAAWVTWEQARKVLAETRTAKHSAQQAFGAGETSRAALLSAEIQTVVAERDSLTALQQTQVDLGVLEDALERPIESDNQTPFPQRAPRRKEAVP